jgi:hypothetical protein
MGITAYRKNGGALGKSAAMANRASTRPTQLYDRRREEVTLDEVERIVIRETEDRMFCSVAKLLPRSLVHVIAASSLIIVLGCMIAGTGTITAYGKPSHGAVPSIKAGTPYAQARKQMLSAGFAFYHVGTYRLLKEPCLGREDVCGAYPEAADCAGTGNGDCEFLFSKGRGIMVMIHTVGERREDLTVQDVRRLTRAQVAKMF